MANALALVPSLSSLDVEAAPVRDVDYVETALYRAERALEVLPESSQQELRQSIAALRSELPLALRVLGDARDNLVANYLDLILINYATTLRQLAFAAVGAAQ
jgi:hypothetical protein